MVSQLQAASGPTFSIITDESKELKFEQIVLSRDAFGRAESNSLRNVQQFHLISEQMYT